MVIYNAHMFGPFLGMLAVRARTMRKSTGACAGPKMGILGVSPP